VNDATQVRQRLDDWMTPLAPRAEGWLGSTAGVTDDGMFVAIARFDSVDAARRSSSRAEQGEWSSGMSKLFAGEVTFHDCSEAVIARAGGSDQARFVQIMQAGCGTSPGCARSTRSSSNAFPSCGPSCWTTW